MKPRLCVWIAPAGALVSCAVALGLLGTPASANVFATDLRFSAPAVDATQPNASVDLTFRLNEAADQAVRVDIYRADNNTLVRSANLGSKPKGLNSYTWDLKDDSSTPVPTNIQYYFKVYTKATGYGTWTKISDDNAQTAKFYHARSLDVNRNAGSKYFGMAYISNTSAGATTAPPAPQRTTTQGLYAVWPDYSDPFSLGDTGRGGGVAWPVSATSPYHIVVGPDSKIYLFDWSDTLDGNAFVAAPDLSGSWTALLANPPAPSGTVVGAPYTVGLVNVPAAQHGSLSGGYIDGKGLSRTLYTVDEDMLCSSPNDTANQRSKGSIWKYDVGPLDQPYSQLPTIFWNDYYPSRINNFNNDLVRDAEGNWYITQYRSNGTDYSSVSKLPPDANAGNNYALSWGSLTSWGSPDPLRNNVSGLAIDDSHSRIASASISGFVNVFNKSLDKSTLVQVGGGAALWSAGANSKLWYSNNTGTSFSPGAAPAPGIQLNDVHVDTAAATTGPTYNGWAVGNGGNIFQLTYPNTWGSATSGTTENLNGVVSIWNAVSPPIVNGWAVGDNGAIVKNISGAWEIDSPVTSTKLNAIGRRVSSYAGPAYDLYVVGDGGLSMRRLDAQDTQSTWEVLTSGTTQNLNDVSMLLFAISAATSTGVTVGDAGTILRTTDGGTTWTPATTSGTTQNLYGVYATTTTDAWAVGANGTIVHTSDGDNWSAQTSGTTNTLRSVWFKDNQTGIAVGDGGVTLRTTNGGATWTTVSGTGTDNLRGIIGVAIAQGTPRDVAFDAAGNLWVSDNGTELVRTYSPPDGENEFTTTSYYKFVPTNGDASKPATPVVTAPATSSSNSSLSASWTGTGVSYQYAIGVTADPDADDVANYTLGWTDTGATSASPTGLSLSNGVKYFFYVRAKSANGVWSDVGVSAGTLVQAPSKIGEAKTKADNAQVSLVDVVVTASTPTEFVVQEQDRSAGIRVICTANPAINTLVTVSGLMGTDGPERVLNAQPADVSVGSAFTPGSLYTTQKRLGGSLATGGAGLSDDALLVRIAGKVTAWDVIGGAIYVDDGSEVLNDTPNLTQVTAVKGIKVKTDAIPNNIGDPVIVTGIVRLEQAGANVIPRIDPRDLNDVNIAP